MGRDVRVRRSQLQRMIAPPMVVTGTLLALFSSRWGSSTPSPVDPWLQFRRAPLLASRLRLGATTPTASAKQSFSSELKEAKKSNAKAALKEPPLAPPVAPPSPPPPPKEEAKTAKSEVEPTPVASKVAAAKVSPQPDNAAASDFLDWAGWAKDARKAADEAELKAWSKELSERYAARAQVTTYLAAATALDGVAVAPVWAPYAVVAAGVLAVIIAVASALTVPTPAPTIRQAPPAVISAPAAAPKATLVPSAPPPVPAKPAPLPSPPAMPTPAPMPAPVVPKAPVKPAPVVSPAKVEPSWGQVAASALSNGLRSAADTVPKLEKDIEESIPTVQRGVTWLVEARPQNFEQKVAEALPVVGNVAFKGLEFVARTGLQVGSVALDKIADTLPAAGQVVSNAMVDAIPATQETVRNAAAATKALAPKAAELSKTLTLPANMPEDEIKAILAQLPMVLNGTASGLEVIADEVPAAERLIVYGAGKALPVVQAALETTSEVAADAAKVDVSQVQLPSGEQVSGALKAVGVDVNQLGAEAQRVAGEFTSSASSSIEAWFKETVGGATDSPAPVSQPSPAVAKQVAAVAKKASSAAEPPTYDALFER